MYFKCSNVPFRAAAWQGQRWPLALLLPRAPGRDPVPWSVSPSRFHGRSRGSQRMVGPVLSLVPPCHRVLVPLGAQGAISDWAVGHQTLGNVNRGSFWKENPAGTSTSTFASLGSGK